MTSYDVFNGDADGICALHQLRLTHPRPRARLITGTKRDIRLLSRLAGVQNQEITVLDISLNSNRDELLALLADNCRIFYADHHFAGDIPANPLLETHIDPDPETCTSLIIDRLLNGRHRPWAVVAAFGDNLHESAGRAADSLNLTETDLAALQELGELLNYNGYGFSLEDLHFHPRALYEALRPFADPFDFYQDSKVLAKLRRGFNEDLKKARSHGPRQENRAGRIFELPPEPWARRISGVFSNEIARQQPDLAHALLVASPDRSYRISVRAPLTRKSGADTLCRLFPTGGGRAAAAGINNLPPERLADFFQDFAETFALE